MERRVKVQWTIPAKKMLAKQPKNIRRRILEKTAALAETDPSTAYKRLHAPLDGFHTIKVSRYRTLYQVQEEELANGDVLVHVRVLVVAVGLRKEGDRRDIYRLAQKLIRFADLSATDGETEPPQEASD